jgi:hypothetical protein
MENNEYNNYNNVETNYQPQPGVTMVNPAYDPGYAETASRFLKKAITAAILAGFPVASIIGMIMGTNNRRAILDYLDKGGLHTTRIKICSIVSRGAFFGGIGFTIFYAFYFLYIMLFLVLACVGMRR